MHKEVDQYSLTPSWDIVLQLSATRISSRGMTPNKLNKSNRETGNQGKEDSDEYPWSGQLKRWIQKTALPRIIRMRENQKGCDL